MAPPELQIMVGKTVEEANKVAMDMDLVVRLMSVDEEPYSLESSFLETRINLKIEKGIVVEIGVG